MISYVLPYPPTVNGLFVEYAGKRIKTRAYASWRVEAGWEIARQGKKSIAGPCAILLQCVAPDNRKRDISNLIKAVEDLLVEMGVIEDDSLVVTVTAAWVKQGLPCLVTVYEFEQPAEAVRLVP